MFALYMLHENWCNFVPLLQNETSQLSGSGDVIRVRRNLGANT